MLATQIKRQWEQHKNGYSPAQRQAALDELAAYFLELSAENFLGEEEDDGIDDDPYNG